MLSSTFYVLYVLEFVSFTELGILLSIRFITQSIIDYPSGIISDKIGYHRVLAIAYIFHAISFALLLFSETFNDFLVVYLIESFAIAQESGALESWFDNQYRLVVEDDDTREIYGIFRSRNLFSQSVLTGFAIIIGGSFADTFSRKFIFSIQVIIMVFLALAFLFTLTTGDRNPPKNEIVTGEPTGISNYLKQGFVVFKNRNDRLIIFGYMMLGIAGFTWGQLILFPLYFGYSGSDFGAGVIRSSTFVTESIMVLLAGKFTRKRASRSWFALFVALEGIVFFASFAIFLHLVPFTNKFEIETYLTIICLFILADFIGLAAHLIQRKIYVDLIPNDVRNSFYSLETTLTVLFASPLMIIVGYIIDIHGFAIAVAVLGIFPIIGGILIFLGRETHIQMKASEPISPH